MTPNMGGTKIYEPLEYALKSFLGGKKVVSKDKKV